MRDAELRTPPHNLDAERAVLGTFFINSDALADVVALLDAADFYHPQHAEIFRAMLKLKAANAPIDPLTVIDALESGNNLERVGGASAITGLEAYVVSPGNVLYHAEIVLEKSRLRKLARVAWNLNENAMSETTPSNELLVEALQTVTAMLQGAEQDSFTTATEAARELTTKLDEQDQRGDKASEMPTGIVLLDAMMGGLHRSDLNILAARTSIGKTSLALQIGLNAAEHGVGVAFYSLEMPTDQYMMRMACFLSRVDLLRVRKNETTAVEREKIAGALQHIAGLPLWINDSARADPDELLSQLTYMKTRYPSLGLVIVDYMQLMRPRGRFENETVRVAHCSAGLKHVAKACDVSMLALSQLSLPEGRNDSKAPTIYELRYGGSIGQDADAVMMLHRESNTDQVDKVSLAVVKQRNGPTGKFYLAFYRPITRFGPWVDGAHEDKFKQPAWAQTRYGQPSE